VFQLLVIGDGVWELHHAGVPLATVQFGAPRLPEQRLRRQRLDDIAGRVFGECDSDALWALATAAADAEHGTMLVVSERAAAEAARLGSQALTVEPTPAVLAPAVLVPAVLAPAVLVPAVLAPAALMPGVLVPAACLRVSAGLIAGGRPV
jgi:hypothetical protein